MNRRPSLTDRVTAGDAAFAGVRDQLRFRYIPLERIRPNPGNPRVYFDEAQLASLAASIKEVGVIQPISVRHIGEDQYEVIAGGRRYEAARRAGKTDIPAVIRDDAATAAVSLIENLQREDLNPVEEAMALQHLLDTEGINRTELAERIGRSPAYITQVLGLLELDETIKEAVLAGAQAAKTQLRELANLSRERQRELFARIIEGATVRELQAERNAPVGKPRGRTPFFQQVERRLKKLQPDLPETSPDDRAALRAELESLTNALAKFMRVLDRVDAGEI